MGNGVEQHFRKEELSFLKQVEEWVEEVRLQYAPVFDELFGSTPTVYCGGDCGSI